MADETNPQDFAEDDWGAALAEQAKTDAGVAAAEQQPAPAAFKDFGSANVKSGSHNDIDFIMDIPVQLTVELDGLAGEPMDVLVNGCLIAQGEVVVVNDKFGIRLTDIISPSERIRRLNK